MWLRRLDAVAHFLYCPAMLGRRLARARWYHRIHLIPGWALAWVCDRLETRLLESSIVPDSGKAITPKALPTARMVDPYGFACEHVSITTGGAARLLSATAYCGCDMRPVWPTR